MNSTDHMSSWYQGDSQIESMLQELEIYVQDLGESMESFQSERSVALQRQKQAIANYDKEIQEIEEIEYYGAQKWAAMSDLR
jgi:hypothetical protein